jgi:hypothetical protein
MWKDGMAYRLCFCIRNSMYTKYYGDQCTKEVTVVPGRAFNVEAAQAP